MLKYCSSYNITRTVNSIPFEIELKFDAVVENEEIWKFEVEVKVEAEIEV